MAFEDLLDHKCAIYHLKEKKDGQDLGFGIKDTEFSYDAVPDLNDIPCHFHVKNNGMGSIEQTEDANEYIVVGKLQFPVGTEVYVNDKIVDLGTGLVYTAEIPRNIRDHHIMVQVQRKGKVKGAL